MTTSPEHREGLQLVARLGGAEHGLAVVVTQRRDGEPSPSVVNAGVLPHPLTGDPVVAFVAVGGTAKLANLRRHPRATLVFRAGWEWVAVAGPVDQRLSRGQPRGRTGACPGRFCCRPST